MIYRTIYHIKSFMKELNKDHVGAYAAQAAFFVILSFIPFMMILLSALRFTILKYSDFTKADIITMALQMIPSSIDAIVLGIIEEVYERSGSNAALSVSIIVAIWSAARGMMSISNGLNCVYEVVETRNYFVVRIKAAFYTVIFIVAILLSLVLVVFGNSIHKILMIYVPLITDISKLIIHFRFLIVLTILIVFFCVLYEFIPNRKSSVRNQLPGAIFAAVTWSVFSYGFSIYVDYFHGFSNMYGSLTTLIIIMLWLYACMYLMLIGAEINAYFENGIGKLLDRKH